MVHTIQGLDMVRFSLCEKKALFLPTKKIVVAEGQVTFVHKDLMNESMHFSLLCMF